VIQPVGYFKIWRELFTKPIWLNSTPEQKTILVILLAMANFRENKWEWEGKPFECKPGQFIASAKSIENSCGSGVTRQNIRTALQRFSKLDFLTIKSTKTGMLITILNWERYQCEECEPNQQTNQKLTISQPTANHQLTTKEESKEGKKEKKKIYSDLISSFTSDLELIKTINDFMEMRKKIKKPMTDRAVQLLLSELAKLSTDTTTQIKILEQSILKNWQGVFPLKEEPKKFNVEEWVNS
jgi:hypothetical protein